MRVAVLLLTVACTLPAAAAFAPSAMLPRASSILARSRPALLPAASAARHTGTVASAGRRGVLGSAAFPLVSQRVARRPTSLSMSTAAPVKVDVAEVIELPTNENNENLLKIRCGRDAGLMEMRQGNKQTCAYCWSNASCRVHV